MARAKELLRLGRELSAREAVDWGLIHRAVPDDQLDDAVDERMRETLLDRTYGRLRSPLLGPGGALYVTTSAGTLSASFSRIYVGNLTLPAGSKVTVVYGSRAGGGPGARATSLVTTQTWKVRQESTPFPFSRFKAIAASPKIRVT